MSFRQFCWWLVFFVACWAVAIVIWVHA